MRQQIKVKKVKDGKIGLYDSLGISCKRKSQLELILINKFKSYQTITEVIQDVWNSDMPDNETCICLIGIGRAHKANNVLGGLLSNIKISE